jgi:hypothetical protein
VKAVIDREGERVMEYMLMCCIDEERWTGLPEAERDRVMREYDALIRDIGASGRLRASVKLQPSATSTTVRESSNRTVITDGPFAETKEQLGGYHVVECRDLDEAIAIAARIPSLRVGGAVDVRPIENSAFGR